MKYETRNKPRKPGLKLDLWTIHNAILGTTPYQNIDVDALKEQYPRLGRLIDYLWLVRVEESYIIKTLRDERNKI